MGPSGRFKENGPITPTTLELVTRTAPVKEVASLVSEAYRSENKIAESFASMLDVENSAISLL